MGQLCSNGGILLAVSQISELQMLGLSVQPRQ